MSDTVTVQNSTQAVLDCGTGETKCLVYRLNQETDHPVLFKEISVPNCLVDIEVENLDSEEGSVEIFDFLSKVLSSI